MNVLLINSTWPYLESKHYKINVYTPEISTVWPPIGIGYIASCLEKYSHRVAIFDRNAEIAKLGNYESVNKKMVQMLEAFQADIVGISATTPTAEDAFFCSRIIKEIDPSVIVVLGGAHATALPEKILNKNKSIDIVSIGEGEETTVELCSGIALNQIRGIAFRNSDGEITITEKRAPIKNIDKIPYPARHLFDMDFYLKPSTQVIFGYKCSATSIISSRGCPNSCAFCAGPTMSQNKVRFHSVDYTINEIEMLINNYNVGGLFFTDEMFTGNRNRVLELCEQMVGRQMQNKIVWGAQLRVDYIDSQLLSAMKRAGCVQVEYGFESGSPRILKEMNKNITVEQCIAASRITKEVGLRQLANIIVGWPTEGLDDLLLTIKLVEETDPDFVSWHEFKPLPGSEGWKYAELYNMEENSFEKNEPFLFTTVSVEEKKEMIRVYTRCLEKQRGKTNTSSGLYSETSDSSK